MCPRILAAQVPNQSEQAVRAQGRGRNVHGPDLAQRVSPAPFIWPMDHPTLMGPDEFDVPDFLLLNIFL